jgi:lipopolysaccharide biosynthesis glycosyltransferase
MTVTLRVACAADEAYVGHCAAMMHSLLTQHRGNDVEIHFLHGPDFPHGVRDQLTTFVHDQGGRLELHVVDDDAVAGLPTLPGIPRVMWYRVFLPDLLPDIDRILYLDADTLVVDRLDALWKEPVAGAYVAAVTNVFPPGLRDRPRDLGLPAGQAYFNSGVLLLALDEMRAGECTARMLHYARNRQLPWPDQDALNFVLGARCVPLHPRWNCMNSLYVFPRAREVFGADVVRSARERPAIVHFEGPGLAKPWHYLSKHPFAPAYRRHRAATPWPDVVLEGRSWQHALLRPLPTRASITVLEQVHRARHRLRRLRSAR